MNKELYEDAFDSLKQSSDDIMQDVIDDNIPDLIDDFKYKIHLTFSGIVPQIRKPDVFFEQLKKFDNMLKYFMDLSIIFSDFGSCVYTVDENEMIGRTWFAQYRYKKPINNQLFTNSNGQKIFNDPRFVDDDEEMQLYAKNFSLVVQCDMNESKSNVINLLKFIKITVLKLAQKCFVYNGKSKCKVFSMWIRKTSADENSKRRKDYFSQASSYLENVINKKDDKATRKVIQKLNTFILGHDRNPNIDKWFSSGTVSAPVQEIISWFGIKVKDVYVDEDDTSVRIEVPEKVNLKTWSMRRIVEMIEKTNKYFCFTINGRIQIPLSTYDDGAYQTFVNKYLYPNVNQMVVTGYMLKDEDYYSKNRTLDLSRFYINDLKVKFEVPSYIKDEYTHKWDIKLNPSSPPKKFKETIK